MQKLRQAAGTCLFWLGWPFFYFYLRDSRRTRIAIVHDNQVLLVKKCISPGAWNLPGGGIKAGETFGQGGARELLEETGLVLKPTQLRLVDEVAHRQYGLRFNVVGLVVELPAKPDLALSPELTDARWFALAELPKMHLAAEASTVLQAWSKKLNLVQ